MAEYHISVKGSKNIDRLFYEVYLDMKKRLYLRKEPLPQDYEKVDCNCETDTCYRVRG